MKAQAVSREELDLQPTQFAVPQAGFPSMPREEIWSSQTLIPFAGGVHLGNTMRNNHHAIGTVMQGLEKGVLKATVDINWIQAFAIEQEHKGAT